MTRDEQVQFVDEARRAAATVATEAEMTRWHEIYANSSLYVQIDDKGRDAIEDMYDRTLRRLWGVGAG